MLPQSKGPVKPKSGEVRIGVIGKSSPPSPEKKPSKKRDHG